MQLWQKERQIFPGRVFTERMMYEIASGFVRRMSNARLMQKLYLIRTAFAVFVFAAFVAAPMPSPAQVAVGIGVGVAPPAMPVYAQPPAYRANTIWTPGYYAYGSGRYRWMAGTWVTAPGVGQLYTPGYWGWRSNAYYWHRPYWGRTVGFYGGINYGNGYFGTGYVGGRWYGSAFRYNTAVTNVNRTAIHNTYVDKTVYHNNYNRVSYNGGKGGIHAQPVTGETTVHSHPPTTEHHGHATPQSNKPPR
jgi:hypothetical protein